MTDDELKAEYTRLIQLQEDRKLQIFNRRKERHKKVDFVNPLFLSKIKKLESEMKDRGLK